MRQAGIDPAQVKGIGVDATCSLAVLAEETDTPISVCGPDFTDNERNVICGLESALMHESTSS